MRKELTIVARIEAKAHKTEWVKCEMLKLIEPTLKEPGCREYLLHQDNKNPAVFLFYESWMSRELWQEHMQSHHIEEYVQATEGSIASFSVNEMTRLSDL